MLNFNKILSKDLYWLCPYLEEVQEDVPLDRVQKIAYYKNRPGMPEHHQAITHLLGNNKTFRIFIRTNLPKEKRIPIDQDNQENVLWFLAHELSHTVVWEHKKEHFSFMAKLFNKFGKVLERIGWEEDRNKK